MARATRWPATTNTDRTEHERPDSSSNGERKDIWSTLLKNVASGKKLPEKNLIVLGGSEESQKEFIDSLAQEQLSRFRPQDRSRNRKAPLANRFALGYTYQNVFGVDHDDVLARLSFYTLNEPSLAYAPLLSRLLTAESVPHTSVAILLDWAEPWKFVRLLRAWIRLLKHVMATLSQEAQSTVEENDMTWRRNRDTESGSSITDSHTPMPLGPGEYDEPIGLPLLAVCQNALAVEQLEKERGFRESHFDYIMQFLRTVLLKHGAGLIYTMPSQPGQLQPLIHHLLDIGQNMPGERLASEKAEHGLKHNVVDRERVMVPPGWDSWGKIRVLREGFDVEGISRVWGVEVESTNDTDYGHGFATNGNVGGRSEENASDGAEQTGLSEETDQESIVSIYEAQIQDPRPPENAITSIEVDHKPDQIFLAEQLERLESFRSEDESVKKQRDQSRRTMTSEESGGRGSMQDTIGPVQFNMGGIQYDADEALKRLKDRSKVVQPNTQSTPERSRTRESTPFTPNSPPQFDSGKDIPVENLEAYFASLMKGGRAGSASATNSPRVTSTSSPRPTPRESQG